MFSIRAFRVPCRRPSGKHGQYINAHRTAYWAILQNGEEIARVLTKEGAFALLDLIIRPEPADV